MGYTHYWTVKKSFTDEQWERFTKEVKQIFDNTTVPLAGPGGAVGTAPVINGKYVAFNGRVTEGSHETCLVSKKATDFEFCKTARLPYDEVVVNVLKLARNINPSVELSSDGGEEVFG